MLRNMFFAVLGVLAVAASSQAAVIISGTSLTDGVPTTGRPGYRTYTLTATSQVAGELIAGFDFFGTAEAPLGFTGPMGQVFGGPIPENSTVFMDSNAFFGFLTPPADVSQDSQFKFQSTAVLVPTGFSVETATSLKAAFALPNPVQSVAFAQLSIPEAAAGSVSYNGLIGFPTALGLPLQSVSGVVGGPIGGDPPIALDGGPIVRIQGGVVNHTFQTSAGTPPITWGNLVSTGPGGATPTNAPVLNADGTFSWTSNQAGALGTWTFDATATNPHGTDVGRLSVELIVPEPATLSLFGLAMIGLVGLARRRG